MHPEKRLQDLKYSELRKIAKSTGIRANLKQEKLLRLLQEHYQKSGISEKVTSVQSDGPKSNSPDININRPVQKDVLPNTPVVRSPRSSSASLTRTPATPIQSFEQRPTAEDSMEEITFKKQVCDVKKSADGFNTMEIPDCHSTTHSSKIPRLEITNKSSMKENKKKTPDWKKIHKKTFSQFESIEDYVDRKNRRAKAVSGSLKKIKKLVDDTNAALKKLTENGSSATATSASRETKAFSTVVTVTPLKPSVKKSDFSFNVNKASTAKSSCKMSKTPVSQSVKSSTKTNRASQTPRSGLKTNTRISEKTVFDLTASLAKPLTWKPHKGKLKPLDASRPAYKSSNNNLSERIKNRRQMEKISLANRRQERKFEKQMKCRGVQ